MENEGGAGGKVRKRPLRQSRATPYNRPPSAARPVIGSDSEDGGGRDGWLARIVDPASRLISGGANWFISSLFRNRLEAPLLLAPPPQSSTRTASPPQSSTRTASPPQSPTQVAHDEHGGKENVHDVSSTKILTPRVHNRRDKNEPTDEGNSGSDGISELELRLNQRTFTRDEFERLAELLRLRTVGLSTDSKGQHVEASMEALGLSTDRKDQQVKTSTPKNVIEGQEQKGNNIRTSNLFSNTLESYSKLSCEAVQEPEERSASPIEVAKAYMDSRSLKPAVHSISRRESASLVSSQLLSKPSDISAGTRSSIPSAGLPESSLRTPNTRGRSAMYRMARSPYFKPRTVASRSPYFKPQTMDFERDHELFDEGHSGLPRSPLVRSDLSLSTDKQVLKRRSFVLDSDLGYFGPMRRVRQKYNLGSSSKQLILSSSGRHLSPSMNEFHDSEVSTEKFSSFDSFKDKTLKIADERIDTFSSAPLQTNRMAARILESVMQSPKKKVSELEVVTMDSPPKRSFDRLNEQQALKSAKDIDFTKALGVQDYVKVDDGSKSIPFNGLKLPTQIQDKPETSGVRRSPASGMAEANGMGVMVTTTTEKKNGMSMGGSTGLVQDVLSPQKPSFKMHVPEFLELDTESQVMEDASVNLAREKENIKVPTEKANLVSSSGTKTDSGLMSSKQDAQEQLSKVTRRDNGFTFHVTPESSSQSPPTPSMPSSLAEKSVSAKEDPDGPLFTFGSRSTSALDSASTSTGGASGLKFGIFPSTKNVISASVSASSSRTSTKQELPTSTKAAVKIGKKNDIMKPDKGPFQCLPASTTLVSGIGSSSSTILSNGSPEDKSSSLSVSAHLTSEPSEKLSGPVPSIVSKSNFTRPTTSTPTKFPVSNATSTPAIVTVTTAAGTDTHTVRMEAKDSEKPLKLPAFGSNSLSSGTCTFGSNNLPSEASMFGSNNPLSGTSATFSSLENSNASSFGAKTSSSSPASTSGHLFGLQSTEAAIATVVTAQSGGSIFSSSSAPATAAASSSFTFSSPSPSFASSTGTFSLTPTSVAADNSGKSHVPLVTQSATGSSIFGLSSGSSFASTAPTTNVFGSSNSSSSPSAASSPSLFSSSTTQASSTLVGFGSSTSSQSTPPIFGSGVGTSSQPSPSIFGSGSGTHLQPTQSVFGSGSGTGSQPIPSIFGSGSGTGSQPTPSIFGSGSGTGSQPTPSIFGSGSGTGSQPTPSIFGSDSGTSSQPTPSIFGFGSGASSQPTASIFGSGTAARPFSFGQASAVTASSIAFGASSSAPFSFTMPASTSTPTPAFRAHKPVFGSSHGNDQMNVEDSSMAEDTTQNAMPMAPVFGQSANPPPMPSGINFGTSSLQPTTFQFGNQPSPAFSQAQSPFQSQGSLEFKAGGSFSLGSGGGDKSGRRMVKVKRDKLRKK